MDFLLGIVLGIFILGAFRISYQVYNTYNTLIKPLDIFINSDISSYTFINRRNTLVKIQFTHNCYLLLTMDSNSVNIFIDNVLVVYSNKDNEKKNTYLFNKIVDGFYHEIYTNITKLNGNILSNNLIVSKSNDDDDDVSIIYPINKYIPTIDDILDKINRSGIKSLTKAELNILGNKYI